MHKRIRILCIGLMLAVLLTACGASPENTPTTEPATQSTTADVSDRAAEGDIASPADISQSADVSHSEATAASTAAPQKETSAQTTAAASGDFGPLFQKYVRDLVDDGEYTITMRQSGMTMETAVRGKESALESNVANVLQIRLINRDGSYFMLMPGTKKYAEMTAEDYAQQASSLQSATLDLSGMHYEKSGTDTVDGKTYRTETYSEDGRGSVTYYFNDAGLQRARVVKDGKTSDVESFTVRDGADGDLFVIPSDYVKVSEPSQLLT